MKNKSVISLLVAVFICGGCSKKDSVDADYFISWKTDGVTFVSHDTKAYYYTDFREFKIEATAGKDFALDGITFEMFDFSTTSPIKLGHGVVHYLGNCSLDRYFTSDDEPGILTVTNYSNNENVIEGTFSFVAKNNSTYFADCNTKKRTKLTITDGKFRIKFIKS